MTPKERERLRIKNAIDLLKKESALEYEKIIIRSETDWLALRLNEMGFSTKKEYLESPYWKNIKKEIYSTRECSCESCGSIGNLELHHKTYKYLGTEDEKKYLYILCRDCHQLVHDLHNLNKRTKYDNFASLADCTEYVIEHGGDTNSFGIRALSIIRQKEIIQDAEERLHDKKYINNEKKEESKGRKVHLSGSKYSGNAKSFEELEKIKQNNELARMKKEQENRRLQRRNNEKYLLSRKPKSHKQYPEKDNLIVEYKK